MNTEYISLAELFRQRNFEVYERMSPRLQGTLRRSVWYTLASQTALLAFFTLVPHDFWLNRLTPGGFFILHPSVHWSNDLLDLLYEWIPSLMVLNMVSLAMTLAILTISWWMTRPAHIRVHYLATVNVIPTAINAVILAVLAVILALVVALNIACWAVIIVFGTLFVIGFIGALLRG
jgi:hypothetical protein